MNRLRKLAAAFFIFAIFGMAHADFIDYGAYTRDTLSGLDWRDIEGTVGLSYNETIAEMSLGGLVHGWRYATQDEVEQFWLNVHGGVLIGGFAEENDGITDAVAALMGYSYAD